MKFFNILIAILVAILVMAAAVFALWLVGTGIEWMLTWLPEGSDVVLAILFFVGLNVLCYFASYVWRTKLKPYHFWICLISTLALFAMAFS